MTTGNFYSILLFGNHPCTLPMRISKWQKQQQGNEQLYRFDMHLNFNKALSQ
jgi:hypothetical protein